MTSGTAYRPLSNLTYHAVSTFRGHAVIDREHGIRLTNQFKNQARADLGNHCTIAGVTKVTDRATLTAASEIKAWLEASPEHLPKPQCTKGCGGCCYQLVAVTAPEVVMLVRRLKELQPKEVVEMLAARVAATAQIVTAMTQDERDNKDVACPFLENDACLIYPYRPFACISLLSLDAKACQVSLAEDDNAPVPFLGIPHQISSVLQNALHAALAPFKVKLAWLDFVHAVHIALSDLSTSTRWCKGEDAFAAATIGRMANFDLALLARAATGDAKAARMVEEKYGDTPQLPIAFVK